MSPNVYEQPSVQRKVYRIQSKIRPLTICSLAEMPMISLRRIDSRRYLASLSPMKTSGTDSNLSIYQSINRSTVSITSIVLLVADYVLYFVADSRRPFLVVAEHI